MANPMRLSIKESIQELKQLRKQQPHHLRSRVQMLVLMKEEKALSKHALANALGVNHNSLQTWRTAYRIGGLSSLLKFERGGFKPSLISRSAHRAIAKRLKSPTEAFNGFKELQQWLCNHYLPGINYHTINKYVKRHFGAKLKIARKSHVAKDEKAVQEFKKNF